MIRTVLIPAILFAAFMASPMLNLQWTDRHSMPLPVAGGAAGFLGDRLVYAGGTAWTDGVKRWLSAGGAGGFACQTKSVKHPAVRH